MQTFQAIIQKVEGKNAAYIEIPYDVQEVHQAKRVKVIATFDGYTYQGSIVKMQSCYMIGITQAIREAIGKDFGDQIDVQIQEDQSVRCVNVPDDFLMSLQAQPSALQYWNTLSYSQQRKYVQWIESAKKRETRMQRIERSTLKLSQQETL